MIVLSNFLSNFLMEKKVASGFLRSKTLRTLFRDQTTEIYSGRKRGKPNALRKP